MGLPGDLWRRQTNLISGRGFADRYHVTRSSIQRLGLETTLQGHGGCVNCLQWSQDGDLLASGSDDLKIMLWKPFCQRPKASHVVRTEHRGNIFSVKFMPHTENRTLVSGAADYQVQVHDVTQQKTVTTFSNHMKRVKRLDVAQDCPNLVWSASEDGTVMETDIRAKPSEVSVLVNLMSVMGRGAEAKCVSVNQKRPEWIAVGASDPYVRIYDRRQLKAKLIEFPADAQLLYERRAFLAQQPRCVHGPATLDACARYCVPGHLHRLEERPPTRGRRGRKESHRRLLACTYTAFSPDGTELLVNLGGEQIYLFDFLDNSSRKLIDTSWFNTFVNPCDVTSAGCSDDVIGTGNSTATANGFSQAAATAANGKTVAKSAILPLTPRAESLKAAANSDFGKDNYSRAILQYNEALAICQHPVLFANRAAAYMKRKWDGDMYAALMDCRSALKLDRGHMKAHLRLCRCLLELKWPQEAAKAIEAFKARFPDHSEVSACKSLVKDIAEALEEMEEEDTELEEDSDDDDRIVGEMSSSLDEEEMEERADFEEAQEEEQLSVSDFLRESATGEDEGQQERLRDDEGERQRRAKAKPPPALRTGFKNAEENASRCGALDFRQRFLGHCNTSTDIKEANFFGNGFVVAGSDDGNLYCWDRETSNICKVLQADESIVNCVQPHPYSCLLASSGIDPVVRLWAPMPEDGSMNDREVTDLDDVTASNQRQMKADPFEAMLRDIGYRIHAGPGGGTGNDDDDNGDDDDNPNVQCRTS